MKRAGVARGLVASCLALSAGCGTAYQPRPTPGISLIISGGGPYYLSAGRRTPLGPLGGDLVSLVAADADAVAFARRSRHQLAFGVPAYVCGVAAVVVGILVAKPAGWAVAGAGAALGGTGIGFMGAGAVNAVDAVNVYNDRVAPRPP